MKQAQLGWMNRSCAHVLTILIIIISQTSVKFLLQHGGAITLNTINCTIFSVLYCMYRDLQQPRILEALPGNSNSVCSLTDSDGLVLSTHWHPPQ